MIFFHKAILGLSCLTLLGMQACTTKSSDNPFKTTEIGEEEFENLPEDAKELYYTGWLLSAFYVNADTELGEFEDYYKQGTKNGFPTDYFEFPDVEYMFYSLSDNYTRYFSPRYAEQIINMLLYSEENVGIGVDIKEVTVPSCETGDDCDETKTKLVFKHVYPGAPAAKAGILKDDTLVTIDGVTPTNANMFQKLASGESGETTSIVVKRGEENRTYVVKFQEYLAPTVFVDIEDSIPVITITEFTDTTYLNTGTYGEFVNALEETKDAKATIIDLRGNPGGSVDQCMNATAELIDKNDTMAFMISHSIDTLTEDPIVDTLTWTASEDGIAKGRYFVFLADTGSASCAELMLVGAISNTKSPVVGLTTYGKGIGQSYLGTYANGIAGITSMRMLDKNKKIYHRYGIEPDYIEGDPDKAMEIAVKLAKERTAVRTKEYGSVDTGHFTLLKSRGLAGKADRPERGGAYKVIREKQQKPFPFK